MWSVDWNVWGFDQDRTFVYVKMIREIFSMSRADAGYPRNFEVDFEVFKDDESEIEAKTTFLVRSLLLACKEHTQSSLLAHYVNIHPHTHTRVHTPTPSPTPHTHTCNLTKSVPHFSYTLFC